MRRAVVAFLVVATACSGADQEVAPTQPPVTTTTSTSSPAPETTLTTQRDSATTVTSMATTTTTTLPSLQSLTYEEVAAIDFPIQLVPRNGSSSLLATKDGQVYLFVDGVVAEDPSLDISDRVRNDGEQGLLSIAVHPDDDTRLFVHYSANDGDTTVEEFAIGPDGVVDPDPVREPLRLDQPAGNHNGGMLQFGPDGLLYLGLGDGGRSNDAFGNGQNRDTLLGGLVALDVDGDSDPTLFQYGLRNPWRFWIDGDLIYVADVGQNAYEEVSVVPFTADINHGWPITEGLHCFSPSSGCDTAGLTLPVLEVAHGDAGTCSITGGHVYGGSLIPEIDGHYFYSDFCGGYLRSFRYEGSAAAESTDWTDQVGAAGNVASFGVDHSGELYVLTTGEVLKIVPVRG